LGRKRRESPLGIEEEEKKSLGEKEKRLHRI
jgi:hypothetical protein